MSYKDSAQDILEAIGGAGNVAETNHCATRLRLRVNDPKKINDDKVKKISGVAGTVIAGNNYKIVIGTDVANVYNEFVKLTGDTSSSAPKEKTKFTWKGLGRTIIDFVSGTFVPILGVLVAAGLISAVLNIGTNFFGLNPKSGTYIVLNAIYEAGFYFLPVYVGFSAAKRLGLNSYLGGMLGAFLIFKTIDSAKGLTFLNISAPMIQYNTSIIPVILGVLFMKLIDMGMQKITPKEIKFFIIPLVEMIVTAPVTLLWLGPLGYQIGTIIVTALTFMNQHLGWFSVGIMAAITPLLVMTGTNQALFPLCIAAVAATGYDAFVLPGMLAANVAVGGAALGVAAYTHDMRQREVALSSGITGVVGITEPSIFGVLINNKIAFLSTIVSAGIGGLLAGLLQVKEFAIVSPGIAALPAFMHAKNGQMDNNFWCALAVLIFSAALSFALTFYFGKKSQKKQEEAIDTNIYAPIDGKAIALSEVNDEVFSKGLVGDGIAIDPENQALYAPADAEVTMVAETKHAIGLKTTDGTEILLHLGLDTVELKGLPFDVKVKEGDKVKKGQLLVDINLEMIKKEGKDPVVLMILTQPDKAFMNKHFGVVKHGNVLGSEQHFEKESNPQLA